MGWDGVGWGGVGWGGNLARDLVQLNLSRLNSAQLNSTYISYHTIYNRARRQSAAEFLPDFGPLETWKLGNQKLEIGNIIGVYLEISHRYLPTVYSHTISSIQYTDNK